MKLLYPVTMSILPSHKYNSEIVALAVMGQAGSALTGQSQYIETTPQIYKAYCAMAGLNMMERIIEIINDGGEVAELEVFLYGPDTILNLDVPEGVRFRENFTTTPYSVNKFSEWNDGAGTQPIFQTPDDHVLLRTNLGGASIPYTEIPILAALTDVTLLDEEQAQQVIQTNSPEL